MTFPRRRLAGLAGSCRCTRPKRQQPTGTTSQRAPPPHTAPGTPRPPAPHNASGIPQSARLGSARLAHLPPGPSLPQNADKAATTHLLPRRGRRRKLKVCPPPSLRPPALSLNRSSCLLQAGRGAPASRVLPPTRGTLRPPRPHIRQGKQTPSASGRRPSAGRIRAVNRPEGSIGAGGPRPSTGARPAVPRAHRRDVRRIRPSSPSSPGALRAGTAGAQPGARRLRPPLSAFFVAVKA